ncbi:GAF domain-containing protein [Sphingomonas ginkgonis]|uniref:GAF domain-containing protein n=1 Tax=Sphingomonas ginkgonis TaxID=2315330 RepID=UPI00163A3E37|nr:GAF domain-containing protein [Sphingomonas ginkgonis]
MDGVQNDGLLLVLSPDWIIRRASENAHKLIGRSHVQLVDEPLSKIFRADPLHSLRNQLGRLGGMPGTMRVYDTLLTDALDRYDVAMTSDERSVLFEAVPTQSDPGELLGSVGHVAARLDGVKPEKIYLEGARRLRALLGYDSVALVGIGGDCLGESLRGGLNDATCSTQPACSIDDHIVAVGDLEGPVVPVFPRLKDGQSAPFATLRVLGDEVSDTLLAEEVKAVLQIPVRVQGRVWGAFVCQHRRPRPLRLEEQAAAELYAQFFALHLQAAGKA